MKLIPALAVLFSLTSLSHGVEKPNIVVILADDLGYGDVRCMNPDKGKIATPNIDRMAAQGMLFTDAHSTSAVCTPTRYSILTGRYNWRSTLQSGVLGGMSPPLIAPDRLTVAEMLRRNGYATACVGKWHLGMTMPEPLAEGRIANSPITRGFDRFFGISASLDMPPYAWIDNDRFTVPPTDTKELYLGRKGPAAPDFTAEAVLPTLGDKAVEWIRANKSRPFFLYLPLTAPHTPLNPTPEWRGKSGLGSYADFVMQTDSTVGRVLGAIDDAGISENTLVVMTSDNGCAPYAGASADVDPMPHGLDSIKSLEAKGHFPSAHLRGYKSDVWEGGHRIPFIVRWPGKIAAGSRSSQLACQVDLFATCADLIDAKVPADAAEDSISLLPILRGTDKPVRETLVNHSISGRFAIREGNWKLALCPGSGGWSKSPQAPENGRPPAIQLYDLLSDPDESENLADKHPEIVARLTEKLEALVAKGRSTPGPDRSNDVQIVIRKDKEKAGKKAKKDKATKP